MKKIIVSFDDDVASAIMMALYERNVMLEARTEGMKGNVPKEVLEWTQCEKSLCWNGYDTICRAIKGLKEHGQ